MHEITQQVRQMYERHPYPFRAPGMASDVHPDLMLSYVERNASPLGLQRQRTMLDAGCGTGSSSLGTAARNPHYRVTAIDLNRTALAEIRAEASNLGIANLDVCEVDMLSLDGLKVPPGGFDVILCSGSLPCIADPTLALQNLARCLAPDGIMRIMVYNRWGRQGIYRFVEALDVLHRERTNIPERLVLARKIMASLEDGPINQDPWRTPNSVDDQEFVDRYLNVHDLSYNVTEFFALLEAGGWQFLRWYEPQHWHLASVLRDAQLCQQLGHLEPRKLWSFVELVGNRPQLDAYVVGPNGRPRAAFDPGGSDLLVLNPQLQLQQHLVPGRHGLLPHATTLGLRQRTPRPATPAERLVVEQLAPAPATFRELRQELEGRVHLEDLLRILEEELVYRYH